MNRVIFAVTVFRAYRDLDLCLTSLWRQTWLPDEVVILDSTPVPEIITTQVRRSITLVQPGRNTGCAASWNYVLSRYPSCDVIIANADTELHETCIEEMCMYTNANPEHDFLYATSGTPVQAWSLFMQRPRLATRIGLYDENFSPAYFEDSDYWMRMQLQGIPRTQVMSARYEHHRGGSLRTLTHAEREDFKLCYAKNEAYYVKKWGGLPDHEVFASPFNEQKGSL